jgi:hypothetical protein
MNVGELIQYLQNHCEGTEEVRIASQPSYPMQYHIGEPELVELYPDCEHVDDCEDLDCRCDCGAHMCEDVEAEVIVYLPEAGQVYEAPYLPSYAAAVLGWGDR